MGSEVKGNDSVDVKYRGKNGINSKKFADDIFAIVKKQMPIYTKDLKQITKTHAPRKTGELESKIRYQMKSKPGKYVSGWIRSLATNPIDKFEYSYKMHETKYKLGIISAGKTAQTSSKIGGVMGRTSGEVGKDYIKNPLYSIGPFYFQHLGQVLGDQLRKKR